MRDELKIIRDTFFEKEKKFLISLLILLSISFKEYRWVHILTLR